MFLSYNLKSETGDVSKEDNDTTLAPAADEPKSVANVMPITEVLASAGRALEGTQAELILQPLRLAFEYKNVKLVEPALDCLHVWIVSLSLSPLLFILWIFDWIWNDPIIFDFTQLLDIIQLPKEG